MKKTVKLFIFLSCGLLLTLNAQVKISDTGSTSPVASAVLELESTTKGFIAPKMTNAQRDAITSPATGLLIFQTDGTSGYYFYDGASWQHLIVNASATTAVTPKVANATLLKTENFVVVSGGDYTMTLPSITGADDGLSITIKNIGSYTTQVNVVGSGGATIDDQDTSKLYRYNARTFIAYNSNWILKEKEIQYSNTYNVGPNESWTTVQEILEFLGIRRHMLAPSVIRLDGGTYTITSTETIDLDNALTIQGPSYGQAYIEASGITSGNPIFNCVSEVSFKMIGFQASGNVPDGIRLSTSEQYHEIKDCTFDGFDKAINITNNVDVWLFESDISNCTIGVDIAVSGGNDYVSFFTSESDFSDCTTGINLTTGDSATISVQNCTFTCSANQIGLDYNGTTFIGIKSLFFTNNTWNNVGTFVNGFDFADATGRDANVEIINNAGIGDKKPQCKINVVNNSSTTNITNSGTYYKASWTNTSAYTVNWLISNNRFTYLPTNSKDVVVYISGNVSVNQSNRTVTIGILKNGTGTISGEISLRGTLLSAGAIVPFSTVVYLQDVAKNNYFELFATSSSNGDQLIFSDVNIYVTSQ